MKNYIQKIFSTIVVIAMLLSIMPTVLPATEVGAYKEGDIYGTTGGGQTEDDPVVVNNFRELDAALRDESIKYVKAVAPESLASVWISSDTVSGNATAVNGYKRLTLAATWDLTNNGTCDHVIAVSGATLEIDGMGTIRYQHGKTTGTGAIIKVNSGATLKVLSDGVTLDGYGSNDLYDAWSNYLSSKENYSRAIYVDGGTAEINGGVYRGVHYGLSIEHIYVSAMYICNNATVTIDGGTYTTTKTAQSGARVVKGGLYISNSPNAKIKSGMFDGIKIDSNDGTDSIYNHLSKGTRMINKQKDKVFNAHTTMTLDDTEAINFTPYQLNYFDLNGKITTGNGNTYSANGSFVAKINEGINFKFNATKLSNELQSKGITAYKSYSIKDSGVSDVAVAGGKEYNSDLYLSGNYIFKKAGKVTLNCYYNFYFYGEHLFSWMTEAVFNVQEGSEISHVDMTVERIKSFYSVPKPVVTTDSNFIFAHYWYKLDDAGQISGGSLRSFGELVAGDKYRLEVRMYPVVGYSFSKTFTVSVNGRLAILDEVTDSGVAIFYIDVPVPEYTLEILGAKAPIAGKLATEYHGYSQSTHDFVAGGSSHYWCTADNQKFTGEFVEGETYYKCWSFNWVNYGQRLPSVDNITITINGAYVPDEDVFMGMSNALMVVKKEFVCVSEGSTEDVMIGDANADGYVDNIDAATILRYDAGMIDLDSQQQIAADVNKDGYVDSLDAAVILKYDAGIIEIF